MWEEFICRHDNIVMVISGHAPAKDVVYRQSEGDNGNIVTEILVDAQGQDADATVGPVGMVATFYVSQDGKTVNVEYYSTIKNKFYKSSTLSFEIAVI